LLSVDGGSTSPHPPHAAAGPYDPCPLTDACPVRRCSACSTRSRKVPDSTLSPGYPSLFVLAAPIACKEGGDHASLDVSSREMRASGPAGCAPPSWGGPSLAETARSASSGSRMRSWMRSLSAASPRPCLANSGANLVSAALLSVGSWVAGCGDMSHLRSRCVFTPPPTQRSEV